MKTLPGNTLTRDKLLLDSVTVKPPAGAAVLSDTGNDNVWFGLKFKFDKIILEGATTLTERLAGVIFGPPTAWIVVEPAPAPVNITVVKLLLAEIVALAGTLARLGLSELSVIT